MTQSTPAWVPPGAIPWVDPDARDEIAAIRRYLENRINYRLGEIAWSQRYGHEDGTSSTTYMAEIRTLRGELLFLDDIEAGIAA